VTDVLHDRVVVVTVGGSALGPDVAGAVAGAGATVVTVGAADQSPDVEVDLADLAYAHQALDEAVAPHGQLDAVVHASFEPESLVPAPFVEQDPTVVAQVWERSVWSTLATLQFAHVHLRGRGGTVAVLTSTIGDVGGAGFGPWSAAIGAQRALVRSAARQWGPDGISVVALAPDATLVAGPNAVVPTSMAGPTFGNRGTDDDVAGAVVLLLTDAARALTGQTITVDGGSWMSP